MDIFYNYVYLDPRKPGKYEYDNICFLYEPIYFGKGKNDRKYSHITYYKNNRIDRLNKLLYYKLKNIYKEKLSPFIISYNYNINEKLCYDYEKYMISLIGTIDGETIKRGPLCNFCIDNRPPCHKGKTYEEIYGIEEAKKQRIKRTQLQINAGGYFGGRKHSQETLKKLSNIQSGSGNGMYGKKQKDSTKEKISKANKGRKSKRALNYIFIAPTNKHILVNGSDICYFCKIHNISKSTLEKRKNTNTTTKNGKSMNWLLFDKTFYDLYYINKKQEEEIISYTVGAVKQDVDDQNYDEFEI